MGGKIDNLGHNLPSFSKAPDGCTSEASSWDIPCIETSDAEKLCKRPMVSVNMQTYNHEKFIRQAIEGVVMQEADFEYELIIGEDCSKDRTREICFEYQKKYPDKIRVLWAEENVCRLFNQANVNRCAIRSRGRYVAWCEGDDYWTDPKKLQKQVEYMEGHPGCAGCFHEWGKCDEKGRIMEGTGLPDEKKRALTGGDITASWALRMPSGSVRCANTPAWRRYACREGCR